MNHEPPLAKWLRWLVYASAFVPLIIFSQYVSPFHFGKVIVLRSIVQVMAALYLLLIWRDASYRPKGHPILWTFLAFAGAFTITSFTSVAWLQSFWGTLERMGGLFTFWHYFVFYLIAVSVMRTRRDWKILIDLMIGVGVASALYGFLQKTDISFILGSGGRARPFGTIGNPALFAGYQILVAFLALTFSFMKRTMHNWRVWYWVAGGLMLLAAVSTAVRGSLIGIAVGALVWALLWSIFNRSKRAKGILLAGIAGVAVFVLLSILLRSSDLVKNSPYLTRITDFSSSTFTVQTRFWAWEAGLKGWSENTKTVLVGWGPENFNVPFSKYFNPKFFTGPGAETFFDRAHNMFMEVLVTMGLLGLLTYISLFAASFRTFVRFMREGGDSRVLGIGFSAMTVAYIIHNAFIFDTSANFLTFFMLLAYTTHVSLRGMDSEKLQTANTSLHASRIWTGKQVLSACALAVIVLIVVYITNIRPTTANFASTRAIIAGWRGDWAGAVNKYREAIDEDAPGRYEHRNRFAQYLLELAPSDTSKLANYNEVVLQGIEDVKKNTIENPQDYLPYLYLSRLYIILGRNDAESPYNDLALESTQKALEISPTFVRTYYEVAQTYLNKKEYENALEWFKKAADLNPDVGVTYWYLGSVRYQKSTLDKTDTEGAKEALEYFNTAMRKGYALNEADASKMVALYVQLEDYKGVVMFLEQLVKAFPDKTLYMSSLAAAYAKVGRKQEAIDMARRVVELSGDAAKVKADAEKFIKSLGGTL